MRFLVDAQLPERLSRQLTDAGHDALHTAHLSEGNRTSDQDITRLADEQDRVVISKDRDLFNEHLAAIVAAFGDATLVELRSAELVTHDE